MAKTLGDLNQYTDKADIVSINIYGGKSLFKGCREEPKQADIIHCDHAKQCSLYKSGNCLCCRSLGRSRCIYGKVERVQGYLDRAASNSAWCHHFRSHTAYGKLHLKKNDNHFAVIGDYYFFDTGFVGIKGQVYEKGEPLLREAWTANSMFFVKKEDCTADFLKDLFDAVPYALTGGKINKYQDVIVPSLKADIKKKAAELYAAFEKAYPEDANVTYVGKTAFIHTLKAGCTIHDRNGTFVLSKDRSELSCEAYKSAFLPFGAKHITATVKVTEDMTCVITSDDQVAEDTQIV